LGVQDIPDCAICNSIRNADPLDSAKWTVVDCGNPC
jgi:hypothetical protein